MSVRHALLALLAERPKYGLQLRQEFEAGTGELWPLNVGQVYMTLQRLERDGMVASDGPGDDGPKRTYRLTDTGRDELTVWLGPPPPAGAPPRDELVMKVLIALRVPDIDITGLIQDHRQRLVVDMQQLTAVKAGAGEEDVELLLVADAEILRLDATIRWLDAAEARLRSFESRPSTAAADVVSGAPAARPRRAVGSKP